tara:strand:- start:8012 stop:8440 length:429 start_codon:yes stop_codon:yes gene_type:complete
MNEEIKDTLNMQLYSVIQFMGAIGYSFEQLEKGGFLFVDNNGQHKAHKYLSVNTAVKLHNCRWYKTNNKKGEIVYTPDLGQVKGVYLDIEVCPYIHKLSEASKVVMWSKIQYQSKSKDITLANNNAHLVQLADEEYDYFYNY